MDLFISVTQIAENFSWNYLFIFLLLGALIGGIFALIRGVYRTTCKYIVEGILVIVLVFCTPGIVSQLCSIDLSQFFNYEISLNDGKSILLTSVDQTIIDYLDASLNDITTSTTSGDIYNTALSLGHSLVGLIFFVTGMILIAFLTPLIYWLVYLITFMVLLSKERRRNKRHRLIASIEGVVCGTVIASLFLSPLSSLVSIASKASDEIIKTQNNNQDNQEVSNTEFQAILELLSSYNDSAFYSAIGLGSKDPSNVLDNKLMSQVTQANVNGVKTSFYSEIDAILKIADSISSSFSFSSDSNSFNFKIDYQTLLLPEVISGVLSNLSQWQTLVYIMPVLAEIGTNIDQVKDLGVDFSDINWNLDNFFSDINQIYSKLYQAGVITFYAVPLLENSEVPNYFEIDYSKKEDYKQAINVALNSSLIKDNLAKLLANFAFKAKDQLPYLSTLSSSYSNIDFVKLFDTLVDFVFDFCYLQNINTLSMETINNFKDSILNSLDDQMINSITSLVCGGKVIKVNDGQEEVLENNFVGLLGLDIFTSKVMDFELFLKQMISSSDELKKYISNEDIETVAKGITNNELKDEVSKMIGCVKDFKTLADNEGNFDLKDEKNINALNNILDKLDQTKLFKKIAPNILKNVLVNNDQLNNSLFGLSISDFNFSPKDENGNSIFISELKKLVSLLPSIGKVADVFKQGNIDEQLKNIDLTDLEKILTGIIDNKVINPEKRIDGSNLVANDNFNRFLIGLFKNEAFTKIGLSLPNDLNKIVWLGENGEIKHLINLLKVVQDYYSFFTSDNVDLNNISPKMIRELFEKIGSVELFKESLPKMLNSKIAPLLDKIGVSLNFYVIDDYALEGEVLSSIIEKLQQLGTTDFTKVDFLSLDPVQVNSLLTTLAQSSLLKVQIDESGYYVDKFGQVLYSMMNNSNIKSIFNNSLSSNDFSTVEDKLTGKEKENFKWVSNPTYNGTYSYTKDGQQINVDKQLIDTEGQISKFVNLYKQIKDLKLLEKDFDYKSIDGLQVKNLLNAIDDTIFLRNSIPNCLNYLLKDSSKIEFSGTFIDLNSINFSLYTTLSDQERKDEISYLSDIYDYAIYKNSLKEISQGMNVSRNDGINGSTNNYIELTDQQITSFENFLNDIANLQMATTKKNGYSHSFFTTIISSCLSASKVDKFITGSADSELADNLLSSRIETISTSKGNNQWTFDPQLSSSDRIVNNSKSEILNLTRIIRYLVDNKVPTNNLLGYLSMPINVIEQILVYVNNSKLCHYFVPNVFDVFFNKMNINSYLQFDNIQYRTINTHVHTSYNEEDLNYWNENIINFCELLDNINEATNGSLDFNKLKVGTGEGEVNLYNIISPLNKINLFNDSKEYLIYNLISNFKTGNFNTLSYIRDYQTNGIISSYQYNSKKAYMIKNLLFRPGQSEEALKIQCDIISNCLSEVSNLSNIDFNEVKDTSLRDEAYNVLISAFDIKYENSKLNVNSSYLMEEIYSNFLAEKLSNLTNISKENIEFFKTFFFKEGNNDKKDYEYFNIIEIRGLKGLLTLTDLSDKDTNSEEFKKAFKSAFTLMGRKYSNIKPTENDAQLQFLYQIENDSTLTRYNYNNTRLVNSKIAIKLFDNYADKVIIKNNLTLKNIIDSYNIINSNDPIDFNKISFEEAAEKVISYISSTII